MQQNIILRYGQRLVKCRKELGSLFVTSLSELMADDTWSFNHVLGLSMSISLMDTLNAFASVAVPFLVTVFPSINVTMCFTTSIVQEFPYLSTVLTKAWWTTHIEVDLRGMKTIDKRCNIRTLGEQSAVEPIDDHQVSKMIVWLRWFSTVFRNNNSLPKERSTLIHCELTGEPKTNECLHVRGSKACHYYDVITATLLGSDWLLRGCLHDTGMTFIPVRDIFSYHVYIEMPMFVVPEWLYVVTSQRVHAMFDITLVVHFPQECFR